MLQRTFWLSTAACIALALPAAAQAPPASPARAEAPPNTVGEVRVEGTAPPVRTSIDRQSYSVTNDLQATAGSISDALRNLPSVEVDVNGNVSLRGDPNVTILIDGKPSGRFRGEGKGQALQSLPASQIDRVEVITNPSAAFNPEGSAGIINLITRKSAPPGLGGSVRANVGSGGRQNGGLNLTRKAGPVTLNGGLYLRHDSLQQTFRSDRRFQDPLAPGDITQTLRMGSAGTVNVAGVRAGLDYDPDPKTRISLELDYSGVTFATDLLENLRQTTAAGATRADYDNGAGLRQDRDSLEGQVSYRRKWAEDHEFTASLSRERNDEDRTRPILRTFRTPATGPVFELSDNRNRFWNTRLKADYSRPTPGEGKLKLGYAWDSDDNDYRLLFIRGPGAGPYAIDPARSNLFRLDQQVHAAYVTYERPLGDLTALAGLRAEATLIDLDQPTQGVRASNDYVRLYPSLHLSHQLSEAQQLKASYSRRVQRPQAQDYNPFLVYVNPTNRFQGNPDLRPQVTDSFEAGYQYRKQGTILLATGYYRRTRDGVNDVYRDLGGGVILQSKANVGRAQSAGVELVANGRLPGRVTYNVSGNALWNEIDARDLGFGAGVRSAYTVFGRASLSWQATDKDFLQLQGFMNGKQLLSQGYRKPRGGLNLGYRRKFSDQLSGVVTVQDLLDTQGYATVIDTPLFRERSRGESGNRAVLVGFTYTFGGRQRDQGFDFGGPGPS
ncbi:MAG: TonB-dependent receptor [Phenylobacterium sp.]|uniref:TonB-dependent receptor domain-containing protein n=1 Tax=Phenylobacterium sp. TaxID=1871053 RepID=UPI001A501CCB|nr:TonB-dependent receptor [Phenylobacterium sp.]MBL8770638.1 TonB-dependent receptor [Phenylobacterium sp.]